MILAGFILALFFSFLLLTKKNKSKADYVISTWLLLISCHILLFYISDRNLYHKFPHLIGIDLPFPILHMLCLYFYVRLLTSKYQGFYKTDALHFIPVIAVYAYMISFFMKSGKDKYQYFLNIGNNEPYFLAITLIFIIASGIVYIYLTYKMTSAYKKYIGQQFSFLERINLNWLNKLIFGMAIVWLVVFAVKLKHNVLNNDTPFSGNYIIYLSVVLFVCFLGYFGIRQTTVFSDISFYDKPDIDNEVSTLKARYQRSGLKEEQALIIKEKLTYLMDHEKLFLDNKLTLDTLAQKIDISPNYLSQVINEHYSKNFYDFVNFFRIEDFKRKALDKKFKNYSILALALECGFNSKSAFYSVFKKEVGMPPSEFLKKVN